MSIRNCLIFFQFLIQIAFSYKIPLPNSNETFQECFDKILNNYFDDNKFSVTYIFDNEEYRYFIPKPFNNKIMGSVIINSNYIVKLKIFPNNIVMFVDNDLSLKKNLDKLIENRLLWMSEETSKSKYLIVTRNNRNLTKLIEILWNYDVTKIVLITHNKSFNKIKIFGLKRYVNNRNCDAIPYPQFICNCSMLEHDNKSMIILSKKVFANFKGCRMLASVLHHNYMYPYVNSDHSGLYIHVLKILSEKLNFQLIIDRMTYEESRKFLNDNSSFLENMYGNRTTALLAALSFRLVTTTSKYINPTNIIFISNSCWLIPKSIKINSQIIKSIFELYSLVMLVGMLFIMIIVWFIMKNPNIRSSDYNRNINVVDLILILYGMALGMYSKINLKSFALRLIILFYMFFTLEIDTMFRGELSSISTRPVYKNIKTIEQLAESNLTLFTRVIMKRGIGTLNQSTAKLLYDKMEVIGPEFYPFDLIKDFLRYRNFSLSVDNTVADIIVQHSGLASKICQSTYLLNIESRYALRAASPFLSTFNYYIQYVIESGLTSKYVREMSDKNLSMLILEMTNDNVDNKIISLKFEHIQEEFFMFIYGIALALIVFIFEFLIRFYYKFK